MEKPETHMFLCCSYRTKGESQGVCNRKGSADLLQYLESELADRGLGEVMVSSAGCLKCCDYGPVLVVYPEGDWYGPITEEAVDEILDSLEAGEKAERYLIS